MKYLKLKLTFSNDKQPYLLDISSLFYDFELLHDLLLIIYAEEYRFYKFDRWFWFRRGRPIKEEHQIKILRIQKESPLTIEIIVGIIVGLSGALWALVQTFEKISNWRLNKEKLKLEIENLKREVDLKDYERQRVGLELQEKLLGRQAQDQYNALVKRLEKSPFKLKDMEISGCRGNTVDESNL